MKIATIFKYLFDSKYRFLFNASVFHKYNDLSDYEFLCKKYEVKFGEKLNLENPKRFNEKLQWLKLYDRKPEYSIMADKYLVKDYVAKIIGEKYIIPTIEVWNDSEDIDFCSLPNQFVLKCNHNSGLGMYICRNKEKIDIKEVKENLNKGLKQNYYLTNREWPYKNISRKIIAEQYMQDETEGLTDYKVHNFNGVPQFILVCKDRFKNSGLTEDFYTPEWQRMEVKRPNCTNSKEMMEKPKELDEILELSKKLSKGIPFVRTDFYIINHQVYFSEMTFYPASGFEKYEPDEWDYIFGSYLKLPN